MNSISLNKIEKIYSVSINLPASKSISNRLLIVNNLSLSQVKIENISDADDTKLMLWVFKELQKKKHTHIFNLKNAGTTYRFLTAYLANISGSFTLKCDDRMKNRPIDELVYALKTLGAKIEYLQKEGFPPLKIEGTELSGGEIFLSSKKSSQFISALLLIAPVLKKGLKISIEGEKTSTPYILMTLKVLGMFGIEYSFENDEVEIPFQKIIVPKKINVEADWSAAAVWYAFVSLFNEVELYMPYLKSRSIQGDNVLVKIYKELGVETIFDEKGAVIIKKNAPKSYYFEQNLKHSPDLMPILSVNLCLLNIKFKLTGLENLHIKESDRILAIKENLSKFGYILHTDNYGEIEWKGKKTMPSSNKTLNSFNDHRIAMACSLFSVNNNIKIVNPSCVEKSYPNFWDDFLSVTKK